MIQIEQTAMFREFMVQKEFRRKVRLLTTSLITALQIDPRGNQLVNVCGTGVEADNCEAVYWWVQQEACCASCIRVLDFKQLQRRLVHFLLDNTHQTEYHE
jgi:hypothetical protein